MCTEQNFVSKPAIEEIIHVYLVSKCYVTILDKEGSVQNIILDITLFKVHIIRHVFEYAILHELSV